MDARRTEQGSYLEAAMKAIDRSHAGVGGNSEELLALGHAAMGYATCFDHALAITAQRMNKPITGSRTSAKFGMGRVGEGGSALDIDLYVEVRGLPKADARKLVETTHRVCPYSNAVRRNADVHLHVTVA
jgi:Ohr subfamily peroxiredoxin